MDEDTTIEQDLDEIVTKLKTERAQLQDRMQRDQLRINRLNFAIEGLERQAPETPAPAPEAPTRGPSVADMAIKAVEQMHNGATFDKRSLVAKIIVLYPTADMVRVKRGIYSAVAQLKKNGVIELAPGGYRAVRQSPQPA